MLGLLRRFPQGKKANETTAVARKKLAVKKGHGILRSVNAAAEKDILPKTDRWRTSALVPSDGSASRGRAQMLKRGGPNVSAVDQLLTEGGLGT